MGERPVIGVLVADFLPVTIADGIEAELSAPGLLVSVQHRPLGPFAGGELYLPSAIMIFIAGGYFNGFLAKLGEDHYAALKGAAKRLFRRSVPLAISSVGSPGKASKSGFSLAYSVTGEVASGLCFKLILQSEVDPEVGQVGVDAFIDLIRDIHADALDAEAVESFLKYRPVGGTVLVTFDAATRRIVPVDGLAR
ncbi:hypothetical protein [Novosphingobium kaempferiae]|uniref:hypothetical protein n=1 Tax=Novosphingobium kaempferiae TaxID=2896849 RepID=UPI001E56DA04|nr:hypothetical protein [Novosphingobium kaempferiae]